MDFTPRTRHDVEERNKSPRLPDRQGGESSLVQVLRESLQRAARSGDLSLTKRILQQGDDIRAGHNLFGHALRAAAGAGHYPIVRVLIERGADRGGQTVLNDALQAAVHEGHDSDKIVALLIDRGADARVVAPDEVDAAHRRGHLSTVRLLVAKGAQYHGVEDVAPTTNPANQRMTMESRILKPPPSTLR